MPQLPLPPEHEHCLTAAGVLEHMRHTAAMRRAQRMAPAHDWWRHLQPKQPKPPKAVPPRQQPARPNLTDEQAAVKIIEAVCNHFDVTIGQIKSDNILQECAYPRQAVVYLLRSYTKYSISEIGEHVGRSYTAVHSILVRLRSLLKVQANHPVSEAIRTLKQQLGWS